MNFGKFISELQRRNVFKATLAYLAVAWVVAQIASVVFPAFNAPDYFMQVLIYLLGIGLVFWIAFSWIYDLTPSGIQKTDENPLDLETAELNNRRLNKVIVTATIAAVLLLISISFWAGSSWNNQGGVPEVQKIAVLPFSMQSDTTEEAYFNNGLTDALIDELSKVETLRVIELASSSVLSAGFNPSNLLIVRELRTIDYFIQGFIERNENTLSITVDMRPELQEEAVWQKQYKDDVSKVRHLLAEMAADLSAQMGIDFQIRDLPISAGIRPVNPETYELYLKGKHYLSKSTFQDWNKGLVYFQEAVERNPADPYAYSGLAEAYIMLGHSLMPPPDVLPKAEAAAKRAIQLDSTNAEGWAALAHYHTYFGWDWQLADYAFKRANELNPNMAYNHYHRAWYLALFGKMNEAIVEHKLAEELDPFTPLHSAWLGELYRWVGLYEEGLAETEKAAQTERDYALSLFIEGRILFDQGKTEQALETLRRAGEINVGWKYMGYGPVLIRKGNIKEAKEIIAEIESLPKTPFGSLCLAILYAELSDFDNYFKWIENAKGHAWYPWIRVMTDNSDLKKDPRFLELIRELNLPDPAPLEFDLDAL